MTQLTTNDHHVTNLTRYYDFFVFTEMLVVPSGTFGTQVHQETLKLPLEITKDLNKIKFNGFVIFYEVKHSPFYQIRN